MLFRSLESSIELAEYLRDINYQPEQVQDFYPTPGTLSTTMFYTGFDPITLEEVHIPKTKNEKAMQRALLQYKDPMKYDLVLSALTQAGREDLIGYGPKCLVKPRGKKNKEQTNNQSGTQKGYKSENRNKVNTIRSKTKDTPIGKKLKDKSKPISSHGRTNQGIKSVNKKKSKLKKRQ